MDEQEDRDFEVVQRGHNSVKYFLAQAKQPGIDLAKAIYVSHADMEFKFSPAILRKIYELNVEPHYGYNVTSQSTFDAIRKWVYSRYTDESKVSIGRSNTMTWHSMLTVINGVLDATTQLGDSVLIPCPNYYRFIMNTRNFGRVPVQTELKIRDNQLCFDFQEMEEAIVRHKVKLMIFSSPANPGGKRWTKHELAQVRDLMLKYNVYLFSDEIFSDMVELTQEQREMGLSIRDVFTSMLQFQDLRSLLIFGGSYTKTFNGSAIGSSFTICQEPQLQSRLEMARDKFCTWASSISGRALEACYTTREAQEWRAKMLKYIQRNYQQLRAFATLNLPKLHVFEMQTPYLCVVDFRDYHLGGQQLQDAFTRVNVCPTFLDSAYVDPNPDCSMVRLNLAINHKFMQELLMRLQELLAHANDG